MYKIHAPSAKPLMHLFFSPAGLFNPIAAGKRVLLVDVRTEEEMKVSMLRGAVTRQAMYYPTLPSRRAPPDVPQNRGPAPQTCVLFLRRLSV